MMENPRIVIIGGGICGMTALGILSRYRRELSLTVVDKSADSHFLPLLPDVIGRGISPDNLKYPIKDAAGQAGAEFVPEAVTAVDIGARMVVTARQRIAYDYLIIACGTETNFYGNEALRANAWKLDDAYDAAAVRRALDEKEYETHIIGGAGYTGIEIATNLRRYLDARGLKRRVLVVERASSLLGPLPEWMKAYVSANLAGMGIELAVNTTVAGITPEEVVLSSGLKFSRAQLIWAAGVRTPEFLRQLDAQRNPQGRIEIDEYLRLKERCFIAGDAALHTHTGAPLRMSVMYAVGEGVIAAANVVRSVHAAKLIPFRPFDPGYIIPMANNVSCGNVFGMDIRGRFPTVLHFMLSLYRSRGARNRTGILKSLITKGRVE